uniref:Uncharacterized protein n=1 Tax=Arundo donax TaxID=35708 RepID=A0A0A8ZL63_ARUDO
MACKDQKA